MAVDFKAIASFDEALIIIHQDFWLWYDTPLHAEKELQFQHGQLSHTDTAHSGIRLISPETITKSFTGNSCASNEETVNGQTGDSKCWIKSAKTINIVDHGEKNRRGESGVSGETLQVILHGDPGRGSGVEAR